MAACGGMAGAGDGAASGGGVAGARATSGGWAAQAVEPEARAVWPPARAAALGDWRRGGGSAGPAARQSGGLSATSALGLGLGSLRCGYLAARAASRAQGPNWSASSARTAITGRTRKARRKPRPAGVLHLRRRGRTKRRSGQFGLADPATGRPRTTARRSSRARARQEQAASRSVGGAMQACARSRSS